MGTNASYRLCAMGTGGLRTLHFKSDCRGEERELFAALCCLLQRAGVGSELGMINQVILLERREHTPRAHAESTHRECTRRPGSPVRLPILRATEALQCLAPPEPFT